MTNFVTSFFKAIGSLPNTFWGILILGASMYIAVKYNSNIGYYFAGIGSTLVGITHTNPPTDSVTVSKKVEINASDPSS